MDELDIVDKLNIAVDNISTTMRSKDVMREAITTINELRETVKELSTVKIILNDEEVVLDEKISEEVIQNALDTFFFRMVKAASMKKDQVTVNNTDYLKNADGMWTLNSGSSLAILNSAHADVVNAYYILLKTGKD